MKDKKILIWNDKNAGNAFEKDVISTAEKCNSLIEAFQSFQDWKKIDTLQDWIDLVTDPGKYFDKTVLTNVSLSTGGRTPEIESLCKLIGIDRENFLNITSGKSIVESECKPCKKLKLKKGQTAISLSVYKQYQEYLIFNSGFTINEETVLKQKEGFKIFAETEKQLKYYSHFVDLAKILNEHIELNKLGNTQIDQLKSMTGLLILNGKLILDDMKLAETIKYL